MTARETTRAGRKLGLSDLVVPYGRAITQRIKATLGITTNPLSDETFGGQYMAKYAGAEEAAIKEINQKVLLVSEG